MLRTALNHSQRTYGVADKYNVPRMAFMNKMDKMGADFFGSCNQLITKLGKNPVLVQIPIEKKMISGESSTYSR